MSKLNIVGQKFDRLMVISSTEPIKGRTAWNCQCDCGNFKIVKTENLRSGDTKSCGCLNNEKRSLRSKDMYSKVIKYTPEEATAHRVWSANYKEMLFEDFYKLSQQDCYYCGDKPFNTKNSAVCKNSSDNMKENGYFIYNGIDRIDSSLSHTIENCVPCCKFCNFAKRERSEIDFYKWIDRLYKNIEKNK